MKSPDIDNMIKSLEQQLIENKARIKLLMNEDLQDEDGYPTEAALEIIKLWGYDDSKGLFEFIKSIWWMPSFGWHEKTVSHEWKEDIKVYQYHISTGGFSGNESLIRALQENWIMWTTSWVQSRRGGHYIFHRSLDEE
jgi:hypothetical protein